MRLSLAAFICTFLFVQSDFCSRPNSNQPQGGWRYHPLDRLKKIPQVIGSPVDGSSSDEDSNEKRPSRGGPFACATLQRGGGLFTRRMANLGFGVVPPRAVDVHVVEENKEDEPDGFGPGITRDRRVVAGNKRKRSENRVTGFGPRVTRDKRIVVLEEQRSRPADVRYVVLEEYDFLQGQSVRDRSRPEGRRIVVASGSAGVRSVVWGDGDGRQSKRKRGE